MFDFAQASDQSQYQTAKVLVDFQFRCSSLKYAPDMRIPYSEVIFVPR